MATLFARHPVADFEAWRKVYDEYQPVRIRLGVTGEAVYRSADDPNDVTVAFDFATVDEARAFVEAEEMQGVMEKAGDLGSPTIWLTTKV